MEYKRLIISVICAFLTTLMLIVSCISPTQQSQDSAVEPSAARPAKYAGYLVVNNPEGLAALDRVKQQSMAEGIQVAGCEYYSEGDTNFSSLIAKLTRNSSLNLIYVIVNSYERASAEKSLVQLEYPADLKFIEVDPNSKFRLLLLRQERKENISNIVSMDGDGSNFSNLATCDFFISSADWSPLLKRIVFESNMNRYRLEENDIFTMEINGGDVRQLSNSSFGSGPNYRLPDWSPDGNKIAYCKSRTTYTGYTSRFRLAFRYDIYTMNADGSDEKQVVSGTDEETQIAPTWFPDGGRLAYMYTESGFYNIGSMNINTGEVQTFDIKAMFPFNFEENPSYSLSPNGTKIAYSRDTYNNLNNRGREIFIYDVASTSTTRLTDNDYADDVSCWSSDGSKIAFMNRKGINIMNPDGSNPVRIPGTIMSDMLIGFGY